MATPGARGPRHRIARGVYRDRYGLAAVVWLRGRSREHRYPLGTELQTIRDWQDEARQALEDDGPVPAARETFAADVQRYTRLVRTRLASIADRERDLAAWVAIAGDDRRAALKLKTINATLQSWRRTLSASTVNHRRDALSHLYRVLDGAPGIVSQAVRFDLPPPVARAVPLDRIDAVLDLLSGKTEARLRLMRWTGMRPSQMGRLTKDDIDLAGATIRLPRGKGGREAQLPLVGPGLEAARLFVARGAWEPWSCPSAAKAIRRACVALDVPAFGVYQIRHSLASALRQTGADLDDVRALLGHTDSRTTLRYSPVVSSKVVAALERVAAASGSRDRQMPLGD